MEKEEKGPFKVTDIDAEKSNIEQRVTMFVERWIPLPAMALPCEVMDLGQLRDAMGLHPTIDIGDPWPTAEEILLNHGFRWRQMGMSRVMFMREREDAIIDDGYSYAEEVKE